MTAAGLPGHGRWAWDSRGDGRAVRISSHPESGLLNLSLWREDICVGTARLRPDDAASLVAGLTDGLSRLAARPRTVGPDAATLAGLEARLARLENRPPTRWRQVADAVTTWSVRRAVRTRR